MNWYKTAITYNETEQKLYSFLSNRFSIILSIFTGIQVNVNNIEFYDDNRFGFGLNWRDEYSIDSLIFDPVFDPEQDQLGGEEHRDD